MRFASHCFTIVNVSLSMETVLEDPDRAGQGFGEAAQEKFGTPGKW